MGLAANALVTLQELREFMDPGLTGSGDAIPGLEQAINRASDLIQAYLRRQLIASTGDLTEYHTVRYGQCEILLNEWPVLSVTDVSEDASRVYGSNLVVNTDYIVSNPSGKLIRVSGGAGAALWLCGFRAVRVRYKAGWAIADVPARFKDACLEVAATLWKGQQRQNWGVQTMTDQGGNYTRLSLSHLPNSIRDQLAGEVAPGQGQTGERDV